MFTESTRKILWNIWTREPSRTKDNIPSGKRIRHAIDLIITTTKLIEECLEEIYDEITDIIGLASSLYHKVS